ncbi:MAG: ABC transporter permease subunit [Elusimicrobia bacterium]|nr:ABC transporter permease subunit [Elusimicrobiota bacterium]
MDSMKWALLLPNPGGIARVLKANGPYILEQWWATFSVAAVASVIALVAAILLAGIGIRYRHIERFFGPIVALSQSFPLQALTPVIIVALGVGFHIKVLIAFLIAFFPIYASCASATRTLPKSLQAVIAIANPTFFDEVVYVVMPHALPLIVSAAKIGFTLAVLGAVVAEFIQPDRGIGRLLLVAQSSLDMDVIYIAVSLLIVQGVTVYVGLSYIQEKLIQKRGY